MSMPNEMPKPNDKPGSLTESESRVIAGLVHQLRDVHPPKNGNGLTKWLPTINVVLGVLLTLTLGGAAALYKTSSNQLDNNTNDIVAIRNELKALKEDRSARIAKLDEWRDTVETELRTYRVGLSDFRRLEGTVGQIDGRLTTGKEERLTDRDKMLDAINSLKTEVALLRQSVEGRRQGGGPFGENQMWRGPPYPPVLTVRARLRAGGLLLPVVD